jgi:glycosyltransferase involved in cell wall biosynthesis
MWSGTGPVPGLAAGAAGLRGAPVLWTAVSRAAAAQLVRHLPAGSPVQVLHNAADVTARPLTPVDPDGAVRVVSTMRVARRKRPLPLLTIFDEVRRTVDVPMTLTVVGDGPLRRRTEAAAARRGLGSSVTVTGRLPPDEVAPVLARSDVYVAPAVLESFGLAALEARCVGLPVVGRADSGIPEFVRHGEEGLLGATDDELRRNLQRLVEEPATRYRISEHNRTVPSPMTWDAALARHDAAYAAAAVVSGAPRRAGLRALGSRGGP